MTKLYLDNKMVADDYVELNQALKVLRKHGFYVHNLWNVEDVQSIIECDKYQAQEVLDLLFKNEYVNGEIWASMKIVAQELNLKLKE